MTLIPLLRRDSFSRDLQLVSLPRHMDRLLNMTGLYRKSLTGTFSSTNKNSLGVVTLHPWYLCKQNWLCKTVIYKVFKKIEVSSILGRLRPKGLPFSGFRYFYRFFFQVQVYERVGSAAGFHLLKHMKGKGNVLFWSVKDPRSTRCILWSWKVEKTLWFCILFIP